MATIARAGAIIIAVLGLIDPAVTSDRRSRPDVAIVPTDPAHAALVTRVADALDGSFTVVRGPFTSAAGVVIVGNSVPEPLAGSHMPAVAVVLARTRAITIERVDAPRTASPDARVRIDAIVRATGAAGRNLEVDLRDGSIVLDRAIQAVSGDDARIEIPLSFVPASTGGRILRVDARIEGGDAGVHADLAIDVHEARYNVLFFDHRPSWQSTFVRRAVTGDPRFVVTSRVVTSRGISTDAGRPPAALADAAALASFDAVVIGAPELLDAADIDALDRFMRRRGGSVVLLFDRAASGRWERLAGMDGPNTPRTGRFLVRSVAGSDSLAAGLTVWPARLPPGATPVGLAGDAPVVWQTAAGAGRLIVSGALDAWRYRGNPGFDRFWRGLLADAATAPPAVEVRVPGPLRPGERAEVLVTVRDAATNETSGTRVTTSISALIETMAGRERVSLWPDGPAGRFRGAIRAPREPGVYVLEVEADGARGTAFVPVANDVQRARPDRTRSLAAWVRSRSGRVLTADQLADLPDELARIVEVEARTVTWHPMRGAWWIVPFVLLLGIDWWMFRSNLPRIEDDVYS